MDLSVVTSLYCSAPHVDEFHRRVTAAARRLTNDYEIVFVNDGSPDDSLERALSLYERDERVKVIDLSRNFGHHPAIMTGLGHASGDLVFLIDSDLEEEPELLEKFHAEMTSSGADVVFGVQDRRKGNWFERWSGNLFYKVFTWLLGTPVPRNVLTARLMKRNYVNGLLEHRERAVSLLGLWVITGFKQVPVTVRKHSKGRSTYTLGRKIDLTVNSITSFSNRPLVLVFYLGCLISMLAGAAALYLVVRRIFFGQLLVGWPSLIVSVWLLGGITILCMGIFGIYLAKIFTETKQRPYTIIRRTHEHRGGPGT